MSTHATPNSRLTLDAVLAALTELEPERIDSAAERAGPLDVLGDSDDFDDDDFDDDDFEDDDFEEDDEIDFDALARHLNVSVTDLIQWTIDHAHAIASLTPQHTAEASCAAQANRIAEPRPRPVIESWRSACAYEPFGARPGASPCNLDDAQNSKHSTPHTSPKAFPPRNHAHDESASRGALCERTNQSRDSAKRARARAAVYHPPHGSASGTLAANRGGIMHLRRITRFATSLSAATLAFAPALAGLIDQPQYQIETFGQWASLAPIPLYNISSHRDVIEPAEADPAFAAYTNNELIDRLPLAGTERWRDDSDARQTDRFAAEWQRRIYLGEFYAEELQRAADRCRIVFVSPQCVEGEMYYARVRSPLWLAAHDIDVFITGVEVGGVGGSPIQNAEVKLSPEARSSNHDQAIQALGVLPKGTTSVTVRVRVATIQYTRSTNPPKPFGWVHDFTVPVQMLDASKPRGVNAPEITREVQECVPLRGSVAMRGDTPSLRLKFDGNRPQDGVVQTGELARTMVAARVEVLRDGEVIQIVAIHDANEIDFGQDPAASLEGEVAHAALDPEQWGRYTLRVTGDHPSYLSMWHRTQYWTGTYTVPLAEVLESAE